MLVLSRKKGEKIVMSYVNIEITVVSINGSRVRLGISVPTEIAVRRHEIADIAALSVINPTSGNDRPAR